jgi:Glucose dehydrogenase
MPPGNNHKITDNEYMDIFSYILDRNNVENINLKNIATINNDEDDWVSFSDPSTIDRPEDRKSLFKNKKLREFIDLSIQDINYPNANDWTSWRRTPLSHGYTPLTNISKKNINDLKLSWSLTMAEGSNQGTPLVYNGIMFLTHPDNIIQAINAKNGDLIWEYKYNYEKGSKTLGGPTRNIAIFKNKIFLATYDAHIIALDAESGKLVWKTKKANYEDGYTHTSGPVIAEE